MERRSFLHGAGAAGVGALATASATIASAQGTTPALSLPVSTSSGAVGTFSPIRAVEGAGGTLLIEGVLNLVGGGLSAITNQLVRLPATLQQTSCSILNLQLGPISLNLLGLQINLSQITLVITAIPGAGLLGDLLCAIAGLLSGPGAQLGRLVTLLTRLLGLFNR